jgi:hypothetical protein
MLPERDKAFLGDTYHAAAQRQHSGSVAAPQVNKVRKFEPFGGDSFGARRLFIQNQDRGTLATLQEMDRKMVVAYRMLRWISIKQRVQVVLDPCRLHGRKQVIEQVAAL